MGPLSKQRKRRAWNFDPIISKITHRLNYNKIKWTCPFPNYLPLVWASLKENGAKQKPWQGSWQTCGRFNKLLKTKWNTTTTQNRARNPKGPTIVHRQQTTDGNNDDSGGAERTTSSSNHQSIVFDDRQFWGMEEESGKKSADVYVYNQV
mmetsp:Transcript_25202/g.62106  ORF Transcript_25202/g.62106 Transcript_25202/m.62106 type:complete len:150 (-) Transcript_25202:6-455(-)